MNIVVNINPEGMELLMTKVVEFTWSNTDYETASLCEKVRPFFFYNLRSN